MENVLEIKKNIFLACGVFVALHGLFLAAGWLSLVAAGGSVVVVHRLLIAVVSLVEHGI